MMRLLTSLCALAALAVIAPSAGQAAPTKLGSYKDAAGASQPVQGVALMNADGTAANSATSTPCIIAATTSAVTITPGDGTTTQCASTGSAGSYVIGAFSPLPGFPVRLVTNGTWAGSIAVGTSVNNCSTVNPLTVAGQSWGTYTGNANEAVDVPPTTGGVTYCLTVTVSSGTLNAALRQ